MTAILGAPLRARLWRAAMLLSLLMLVSCGDMEGGPIAVGVGSGPSAHRLLTPGLYQYEAWSDTRWPRTSWWGYMDLRVDTRSRISGTYRLPLQCSDAWGYTIDCVGYIGGTIYSDGSFRFGLDEGWLVHEGVLDRSASVRGRWETRILGYRDLGTFELAPAW